MAENISRFELEARLHFLENNAKHMATELAKTKELNKELQVELDRIKELYKLAVDRLFGKKSEKIIIVPEEEQLCLFAKTQNETVKEPSKKLVKEHYRAARRTREQLYGDLPTEEKYYDLTDEEKICTRCGSKMHEFGYDCHTEITYTPAVFNVLKIYKQKCVCRCCEEHIDENGEETPIIVTAKGPSALIKGSMISPSLAAYEINSKICLRLPLYCIEQEYARNGIKRSRQTMCNNMIFFAGMMEPMYQLMHKELKQLEIIHADETPWQVNHIAGKDGAVRGYFWVYCSGKYEKKQIVLYDYENGRAGIYPQKFLDGFKGYVHCDGLEQYSTVLNLIRVGCLAHLKRYFLNAVKVQYDKNDFTTVAGQGFLMINEIFHTEGRDPDNPHTKSNYTLEEIAKIRKEISSKKLKNFFEWCTEKNEEYLPSEKTREAIRYALNQKEALSRFLDDPRLELTNNAAERAVRPVAVGRKNWLFSDSERGAKALSVLFSIVETAKANSLKPYEYLKWIFEIMRSGIRFSFEDFLPWNKKIPEFVRMQGE